MEDRDAEAEAEAVSWVRRFCTRGWDKIATFYKITYIKSQRRQKSLPRPRETTASSMRENLTLLHYLNRCGPKNFF